MLVSMFAPPVVCDEGTVIIYKSWIQLGWGQSAEMTKLLQALLVTTILNLVSDVIRSGVAWRGN